MGVTHTFVSAIADDPVAQAAGQVLPSHWNASHTVNVNLATEVSGVLAVANGGSGTATPSLVAGSNVTITGTWPNQTIAATSGGTPGGSTTQLQYNNAGAFDGTSGITTTGTELTIASGTKTTSAPVVDATQTWNNAGTTFTALKLNVTDTASNAASLIADFQVGGVSQFKVAKNGGITIAAGDITATAGNVVSSAANIGLNSTGGAFYWRSSQTWLYSDSNNALDQRNSTNAQALRVYNTYTDASNYERAKIAWATNVLQIGTEKLGTGTARALELQTDGTTRLTITTSGTVSLSGSLVLPSTGSMSFTSRGIFSASADGVFRFTNNASTDFGRLQLGGTTSSFPAIKRSGTAAQIRLADDSAYAPIEASTVRTATAYTVATLPAAGTAGRKAYVTDALAPTFLGTLTGGGAVVCPVFDNGTAWVAG